MGFFSRQKSPKAPPAARRSSSAKPATSRDGRYGPPGRAPALQAAPVRPPGPPSPPQPAMYHAGPAAPQPVPFQPAGYLPPPVGWHPVPIATAQQPYQAHPYQPIVVNQHYYVQPMPAAPQVAPLPAPSSPLGSLSKLGLASVNNLVAAVPGAATVSHISQIIDGQATTMVHQGAALVDQLSSQLNDVLTKIDQESLTGLLNEGLGIHSPSSPAPAASPPPGLAYAPPNGERGMAISGGRKEKDKKQKKKDNPKVQTTAVAGTLISGNYFAKVDMYANSRLPLNLPPLQLYVPTYPLLCLAAQFAERVYDKPQGKERDAHVSSDWRTGTKAMVIKSVPMDDMNAVVFAIRGTTTFMDWAVNLNMEPASPEGFLDDPGNMCHAGFLTVAKRMVAPVAARLRQLLQEDPSRASHSLVVTGHSAGGAVASLLYMHMMATSRQAESELNVLTGCFKRVHCITFGAPPVSLLPLQKPARHELRKSCFLAFVNEGDPVARADKAYVKSLLELFASPVPAMAAPRMVRPAPATGGSSGRDGKERRDKAPREKRSRANLSSSQKPSSSSSSSSRSRSHSGPPAPSNGMLAPSVPVMPVWRVPASTLSNAGRLVVLRSGNPFAPRRGSGSGSGSGNGRDVVQERLAQGVVAQTVTDEQLRGVIWGDPVCHVMRLYKLRVETLAVGAVTGPRGW